jgi:hypothetical protein
VKQFPKLEIASRKLRSSYCETLNKFDKNIGKTHEFNFENNKASIIYLGKNSVGISNEKTFILYLESNGKNESFFIKILNINNP